MLFLCHKETLIAGPYTGEFGWELMEWQGYVRKLRKNYKRTIVISYINSRYLYENCEFFAHGLSLKESGYAYGIFSNEKNKKIIQDCVKYYRLDGYDLFAPYMLNRLTRFFIGGQSFVKFYEPPIGNKTFDLAFHFRDFERADGSVKNYPKEDVDCIVKECAGMGLNVCFIGYPKLAYCPMGYEDMRSENLADAVSAICSSKIVVGGSSAPMHLASLCNKPIVAWIGPPVTADRYFTNWNPFKSKVYLVTDQTFRPEKDLVIAMIKKAIQDEELTLIK